MTMKDLSVHTHLLLLFRHVIFLILSVQARTLYRSGQYSDGAMAASKALKLSLLSIVLGIVAYIIVGVVIAVEVIGFQRGLNRF